MALKTCGKWAIKDYYGGDSTTPGVPLIRACPNCEVLIEHNSGCRHMTCLSDKCKSQKYSFCFVCLSNWQGHGKKECPVAPR